MVFAVDLNINIQCNAMHRLMSEMLKIVSENKRSKYNVYQIG